MNSWQNGLLEPCCAGLSPCYVDGRFDRRGFVCLLSSIGTCPVPCCLGDTVAVVTSVYYHLSTP